VAVDLADAVAALPQGLQTTAFNISSCSNLLEWSSFRSKE
jgi:hypothetical protein